MIEAIRKYLSDVEAEYRRGNATEHSYRPALKTLLESCGKTIHAVNEPSRVECGAPDFEISRGSAKVGYLEAKDIGKPLNEAERSEQLKRYFRSLENLILTDYLEFRWYVNGEIRTTAKLRQAAGGKVCMKRRKPKSCRKCCWPSSSTSRNPTFRGMRWSLMQSFNDIYILNLHGSLKKKETAPGGGKDENVFDIQQGVCIGIFVKQPGSRRKCQVHYADLWGERQIKYDQLEKLDLSKTKWTKVEPDEPYYLFTPLDRSFFAEYFEGKMLTELFPVNSTGVKTHRDHFAMSFTESEMIERLNNYRDRSISDSEISEVYSLKNTSSFSLPESRKALLEEDDWKDCVTTCLYRPFDNRHYFHSQYVVDRPRNEVTQHFFNRDNIGISTTRSTEIAGGWEHVFCSNQIIQHHTVSLKETNYLFPLYLYFDSGELNFGEAARKPNLSDQFVAELAGKLGMAFVPDGQGDLKKTFGPEDVFHYIYAMLHSPTYRERYADFLKIDFPRVPTTSNTKLFAHLAKLGDELCSLHLMEFEVGRDRRARRDGATVSDGSASRPYLSETSFPVAGSNEVAKGYPRFIVDAASCRVAHEQSTRTDATRLEAASTLGRVHINKEQYFDGVPVSVWNFTIGGYQVGEKWLKDRRERKLSLDDVRHYQKIVVALRAHGRIDAGNRCRHSAVADPVKNEYYRYKPIGA